MLNYGAEKAFFFWKKILAVCVEAQKLSIILNIIS